jgi:hypothetical protein
VLEAARDAADEERDVEDGIETAQVGFTHQW